MWKHQLWSLCVSAWSHVLASLGTTTLAVVIFTGAIPLVIFFLTLIHKRREARKAGHDMSGAAKGSLVPTLIALGVTVIAWAFLFLRSVVITVYRDHEYLVSSVPKAKNNQKSADTYLMEGLRTQIEELKNKQPPVKPQCWMQNVSLPPPRNIPTVMSASQAIFFCNTERKAPLFIWVDYDEPPASVGPVLFPANRQVSMTEGLRDKQIGVHLESPSILPYQIFLVTAYGNEAKPPIATKIQVSPINPER